MKLKSFREWAKQNLKREDHTAGDPQDLLQRAQVCLGKAQDDEIKDFLNDIISFLQQEIGGGEADQATDGANNMAGAGGTGGGEAAGGMQSPVASGGGMQAATM
jgi:hypothetical protein